MNRACIATASRHGWRRVAVVLSTAGIICLLFVRGVDAQIQVVEDWASQRVNAKGVPDGWKELRETLSFVQRQAMRLITANYDFTIVAKSSGKVLHLKSANDHPIMVKDLGVLDLDKTPLLTWEWKVEVLPKDADLSKSEKSDSAAEILIVWKAKGHMIGYAWDETLPLGHQFDGPRAPPQIRVHFFVVGSGKTQLGQWISVTRDVREDYRKSFNSEPPGPPDQIAISIDSNQTKSTAESFIGRIMFRAR
jgi:hypothetical protein